MPKIKHIATGPNGETFKRESASRRYTHCVIGRRSYDHAVRRAHGERSHHASNFRYYAACAAGTYTFPSFYSDAGKLKAQQKGEAWIAEAGCANADEYADRELARQLAELEELKAKGEFDRFFQIGWAGREDLAQKAASQAMTGGYFCETRYIPATIL